MKIRYHHLLCIPRFEGKGYSEEFCENLLRIKPAFDSGDYELTTQADVLCEACPNNINGRCKDNDKVERFDLAVKKSLEAGSLPCPRDVCSDCEWYYICESKQ